MGLKKSKLKDGFLKIFDADGSPPDSTDDCATKMTKVIIDYLGDVQINALPAPGVFPPPPGPGPDPSFSPTKLSPVTPPKANESMIEGGLKAAMKTNSGSSTGAGATKSGWSMADASFIGYVGATFIAFQGGGYTATGATTPGKINLGSILTSESDSFEDISSKLADHVHSFFTGCNFSGAYLKASFVGPAPHVSPLI